ncbi:MAG: MBL fold metallo-hydrolase, partial [Methylobacteriaceae bacterium]|nr:MBL fold metallo-hydrolase [Methylobacteriaceae bacterium]
MKITIVGSGDAFGSGGRAHTCFRIDAEGRTLVVDFGASAITAWKGRGFSSEAIDGVIISHLHGDHFGGLPFLLLDCQFGVRRTRPMVLAGPVGFRARLERTLEALFPGSMAIDWKFPWNVVEMRTGRSQEIAGFRIDTREVHHPAGAPALALRLERGRRTFAYSGDTSWTDALVEIADGSDIFVVECFSGKEPIANHIDWPTLKAQLPRFDSAKIV